MKQLNNILTILAILVIVALSAFNTHRVGEQAKEIAELQQFHALPAVDTFTIEPLWGSIDEVITYRNEDIAWEKTLDAWRNIPEESLKHILLTNGLNLSIEQIVRLYETNIDFYEAYEEGYQANIPIGTPPSELLECEECGLVHK